ncbi:hypothetical protein [Bacillus xiapuensis]|uniref:hypothetical protein n=1 Tax=Bacillus xiapuensis TaxID=2014075 RepID=UPI000C2455ED|nr:hypothetical protein [Bacillus xiapuensis]
MTRIPEQERDLIEKTIYLPMVLTVLNRDKQLIENSSFKLKSPYLEWISETMNAVQRDLTAARRSMQRQQIRVQKLQSDESFTMYLFLYKGYEEQHNYFNPRLRNGVEQLMKYYLYGRFQQQ